MFRFQVILVALGIGLCSSVRAADTALAALTLQQAETLFLEKNRELQAAHRVIEGAQADVLSAGARPNPNLSVSTTSINPGSIGAGTLPNKRIDTIVGLTQLFERGNKAQLRTDAAQALVGAAQKDRAEVERMQRLSLHGAYYDLVQAQEKVRITGETAALFRKSLDALDIRLKAGDVAAVDVARMTVDALRAQNDARSARADLEKSRYAIAYLIGAERDAAQIRAADALPLPKLSAQNAPVNLPQSALDARPDVQAAQARAGAAEKNRELARSLRTRDITAGMQFERYPGNDPRNSVGFSVSVPLFTRYYYDGEIRRAEVEVHAAQEQLQRVLALARMEIGKAASDLASSTERVQRFQDVLLAAAEKAAQGAEFAYSRGAIGVMDLLDARRQLIAARLESVSVHADYARALSAWRAASGATAALAKAGG